MIEIKNVIKSFSGKKILKDISLKINKGEKYVLLGESGSGKTSLLKTINKLLEPDSGDVFYKGENIKNLHAPQFRRNIGYVMQAVNIFPHLTIYDNIALVPRLLHWEENKIELRVCDLMSKLKLSHDLLKRFPRQLSGGQQQRIGVARALAANPPLILMDEPFGSLDLHTKIEIRQELKNMDDFIEKTIVLVTHDIEEAIEMGDTIAFMESGVIVHQLSIDELLFAKSGEVFRKKYLKDHIIIMQMKRIKFASLIPFMDTNFSENFNGVIFLNKDSSVSEVLEKMFFQIDVLIKIIYQEMPHIFVHATVSQIFEAFLSKIKSMEN